MVDQLANLMLLVITPVCIRMSASQSSRTRMQAGLLGLIGQPAYFWIAFQSLQWGLFAAVFFITYAWWQMFWINRQQWRRERNTFC